MRTRLPSFVVPLDTVDGKVARLLLVPCFGACIHQPPASAQPDRPCALRRTRGAGIHVRASVVCAVNATLHLL